MPDELIPLLAILAVLCLKVPSLSQAATPVAYEIRPPSSAWASCPSCGLGPPIRISGGFLLILDESDPSGTLYQVNEFKIQSNYGGEWSGSGTYRRGPGVEAEMVLDYDAGDGTTTRYSGKVFSAGFSPWPVIEIAVANPPEEYFSEGFYLFAAPRSEYVEFQLGFGSEISFGCQGCDLPFGSHALGGTFLMGRIAGDGNSSLYRIDTMNLRTSGGEINWEFGGYGLISVSRGNIEATSKISLGGSNFNWLNQVGFLLWSEGGEIGDPSGRIDVNMVQQLPPAHPDFLGKLRLAAAPSTAAPFLRGDPNADGAVDISDAIGTLSWLFLGSAAPKCEEAADVNADGKQDPSDAIALLSYLFQDGAPPPFPGTRWCGLPQVLTFGCDTRGNCPEWIRW